MKAHPANKVHGEDSAPRDSRGKRNHVWNKMYYFCCSAVRINSGKPHWSVQELWLDHILVHSHTHTKESHPKQNPCADSTLSVTAIPAMCGGQMKVSGAVMGPLQLVCLAETRCTCLLYLKVKEQQQ